jgi:two-component system sensor histidine kinase RegB
MAAALKDRERELAAAREGALRNEQILSLGTLAAGAAHQLGTPLGTMAVVIRELELNHGDNAELQEDLLLVARTGRSLQTDDFADPRFDRVRAATKACYRCRSTPICTVCSTSGRSSVRTPGFSTLQGEQPAPLIAADRTLEQAILNLLDNAADANGTSHEALQFSAHWDAEQLSYRNPRPWPRAACEGALAPRRGFFQHQNRGRDRSGGIGIGLFLSNATIERFGGKVELRNRDDPQGGACTRVTLPLIRLKA